MHASCFFCRAYAWTDNHLTCRILTHNSLYFAVDKGYYGVRVVIGKMLGAGNNYAAHEYIRLIGTKGASEKVYLTGSFEYIAAGTYLDLTIETKGSLGEIQVLTLGIEQRIDDALFVDYSEVKDLSCQADDKETRFPCYHWISGNQSVTTTSKSGE